MPSLSIWRQERCRSHAGVPNARSERLQLLTWSSGHSYRRRPQPKGVLNAYRSQRRALPTHAVQAQGVVFVSAPDQSPLTHGFLDARRSHRQRRTTPAFQLAFGKRHTAFKTPHSQVSLKCTTTHRGCQHPAARDHATPWPGLSQPNKDLRA